MSDLISRQAAIMHFVKAAKKYECGMFDLREATHELWKVPSAEPERKKGRWMPFDNPWYKCSECGAVRKNESFMENFCPYCGADMRGGEE